MDEVEIPIAPGADWRIYAIEEPQYKQLVERMRAELSHVPADDILHISHSIARAGAPHVPKYSVMVIYREQMPDPTSTRRDGP
jgi:hypothetical protein